MKSFKLIEKNAVEVPIWTRSTASVAESEQEPQRRVTDLDAEYDFDYDYNSDDPKDGDFQPPAKQPPTKTRGLDATPKLQRSVGNKSTPTVQKARVTKVDPHHALCLLTNVPEPETARQFCHVLARSMSQATLTALEWWWGMKYWTLYIDTRFNIFALMATWHNSMDGDDWALVPKHDLITKVSQWVAEASSRDPSDLGARKPISKMYGRQTIFEYYFLPLSESMKKVAIHRYPGLPEDFAPQAIVPHYHPFSTIGPLTSHVQPHFAIYSVGQKLAKKIGQFKGRGDERIQVEDFYTNLAAVASFGHEGDDSGLRLTQNRASIDELMLLHASWSKTQGVPQRGHPWAQNPKEGKAAEQAKEKRKADAKRALELVAADEEKSEEEAEAQTEGKGKAKAQ
ncbi:hypothetical protein MSAN_02112500 [Mycena sanguinolenta]|uniref:Uncharacterized protein n=1 Tax=Mycena sanguinolenta TaxID=230812 RepID=A0A8H6XHY5_9AGAR|nr:hypothetical protein MSAN_02112500 [Mycena sanguinolenta]